MSTHEGSHSLPVSKPGAADVTLKGSVSRVGVAVVAPGGLVGELLGTQVAAIRQAPLPFRLVALQVELQLVALKEAPATLRALKVLDARVALEVGEEVAPVSYTHLTLPTTCGV